jgi:glycosyltransferase involved in cell wall biosynthesis
MRTLDDRVNLVLAQCGDSVGRPERVLWELATRLPERFDVHAWLSAAPGLDEFAAALEAREIPVLRVPPAIRPWDLPRRLKVWLGLRRTHPDLIHIHHAYGSDPQLTAALGQAAGDMPLVVSEHGAPEDGRYVPPTTRRTLARAGVLTAACTSSADAMARRVGLDPARVRIVPHGAGTPDDGGEPIAARRLRDELGAAPNHPLWVCASRLEPEKGHTVLLEALLSLSRRDVQFTAALSGDGSLRQALERRAATLGIESSVRFLGAAVELGALLRAADAVVIPSRSDDLPFSALEAMVRGRPVVASAVGGLPDLIEDGVNGLLVPPGEPQLLADALERLARRPDEGRRMGLRASDAVREGYSWSRIVEAYESVYDEALGLATFAPEPEPAGTP